MYGVCVFRSRLVEGMDGHLGFDIIIFNINISCWIVNIYGWWNGGKSRPHGRYGRVCIDYTCVGVCVFDWGSLKDRIKVLLKC